MSSAPSPDPKRRAKAHSRNQPSISTCNQLEHFSGHSSSSDLIVKTRDRQIKL